MEKKKLYKSRSDVKVDGVCAGLSKYFGIDVTIIRIVWLVFALSGSGIVAYFICSILMPREEPVVDYTKTTHEEDNRSN